MRFVTALTTSLLFTGCAFSSHPTPLPTDSVDGLGGDVAPDGAPLAPVDRALPSTYAVQIEDAWLSGETPDFGHFDADAYEVDYGTRPGLIDLHAGARGGDDFGWAMLRLQTGVPGGFQGDSFSADESAREQVSATGCTGPEHGTFTFDQQTTEVETTVEPGPTPHSRVFHFRAEFRSTAGAYPGAYTGAPVGYIEGGFVMVYPVTGLEAELPTGEL